MDGDCVRGRRQRSDGVERALEREGRGGSGRRVSLSPGEEVRHSFRGGRRGRYGRQAPLLPPERRSLEMTVERRMHLRNHHQTDAVLVAPALSSASAYPFDAAPFWWLWNAHQWHSARPARLRRRAALLAFIAWVPLVLAPPLQRGPGHADAWL